MLSVHRHYRSWNDRANEWRAGRWVQDLLSLNQLTSRLLLCVPLGAKWRFTGYGLHRIWILQLWTRHHVHWTGHCTVTGERTCCGELCCHTVRRTPLAVQTILSCPWTRIYEIRHIFYTELQYKVQQTVGGEKRSEHLTPGDPNPLQPTRSALPQCVQSVSYWHRANLPTVNLMSHNKRCWPRVPGVTQQVEYTTISWGLYTF